MGTANARRAAGDGRRAIRCRQCGRWLTLSPSWQRRRSATCDDCRALTALDQLLTPTALAGALPAAWTHDLLRGYAVFLQARGFRPDTRWRRVRAAAALCRRLGAVRPEPLEPPAPPDPLGAGALGALADDSLDAALAGLPAHSRDLLRPTLLAFLVDAGVVANGAAAAERRWLARIAAAVDRSPLPLRPLVARYAAFRLDVRREQRRQRLSRVLALRTVYQDVLTLRRFAVFLTATAPVQMQTQTQARMPAMPVVASWELVTEREVLAFLRALDVHPNSRNVVRWDLHEFFAFAHRHRAVAHNPVPDDHAPEAPPAFRPLPAAEQRRLLARWARLADPVESLVGCLGLLHGLSSAALRGLRVADADVAAGRLRAPGRRVPLVLDPLTRRALAAYAAGRLADPALAHNPYLLATAASRATRDPVSDRFLRQRLRAAGAGVTPTVLRLTCLATVAQQAGPRLLVDGFGLSPTQANRYQRFRSYRADEAVAAFVEHLERRDGPPH